MKPVRSVQIELTNHCNYRCKFCPQAYYKNKEYTGTPFDRNKGYMSLDTFKRSVEQCKKYAQEINFSFFGEPTLHPQYFEILEYLKNNKGNLGIVFNTNLSLVTKETMDAWIDTGIKQCRFSIDAATPDTYDLTRPGGAVKGLDGKFVKGARRLDTIDKKVKYWLGRKDHSPTRHVYVVCQRNVDEIESYVKKWSPLLGDKDEILVKNVLTYGGVINKDTPDFDTLTFTNKCNVWTQRSLTIAWNGDVTPCNLDVNMGLTVGNIFKQDLGQIYQGQKWQETRKLSSERKINPCATCHDANNWTNNVIIKRNGSIDPNKVNRFNENRPKELPRLSNGHK